MAWLIAWSGLVMWGIVSGASDPSYIVGVGISFPLAARLAWKSSQRSGGAGGPRPMDY
jgi:cytochrome b